MNSTFGVFCKRSDGLMDVKNGHEKATSGGSELESIDKIDLINLVIKLNEELEVQKAKVNHVFEREKKLARLVRKMEKSVKKVVKERDDLKGDTEKLDMEVRSLMKKLNVRKEGYKKYNKEEFERLTSLMDRYKKENRQLHQDMVEKDKEMEKKNVELQRRRKRIKQLKREKKEAQELLLDMGELATEAVPTAEDEDENEGEKKEE